MAPGLWQPGSGQFTKDFEGITQRSLIVMRQVLHDDVGPAARGATPLLDAKEKYWILDDFGGLLMGLVAMASLSPLLLGCSGGPVARWACADPRNHSLQQVFRSK